MDKFDKAIVFAVNVHSGQKRKNGVPYILHPLEVAAIAATMTDDKDVLCAAILHDTVEDTEVTSEQICNEFGEKVAGLVASETEDKRHGTPPEQTWRIRKEESFEVLRTTQDINIKILWLSDKLSNMRSFYAVYQKAGDSLWQRFHQKDKAEQYWYYNTVAQLLSDLRDTLAWKEYNELLEKVFETIERERVETDD